MKIQTNQAKHAELLSDEKQSIVDDLGRVIAMIPAMKIQIFKCKGNMFLDKSTQLDLTGLRDILSLYQKRLIKKQKKYDQR